MLMTVSAFGAASAIMTLATLAYIGVGLNFATAEFGVMISKLIDYHAAAPFSFALSIFVIFLTVLSLLMIGSEHRP
jgi:peptide/nickel transport system permease protein